jgi:hypothetical protein
MGEYRCASLFGASRRWTMLIFPVLWDLLDINLNGFCTLVLLSQLSLDPRVQQLCRWYYLVFQVPRQTLDRRQYM